MGWTWVVTQSHNPYNPYKDYSAKNTHTQKEKTKPNQNKTKRQHNPISFFIAGKSSYQRPLKSGNESWLSW